MGAPVAMANQSDCIKKAEAAGFHKSGMLDTGSPPKPVTAAQKTSMPPTVTPNTPAPIASTSTSATAASSVPAVKPSPPVSSTADRLRKLDDLLKSGLITKDEYDRKRQEILSAL